MNNLSAVGNIGSDAEVRHTPSGAVITSWSFALSSGYGDKRKTTWLRCNLFGDRGEKLAPMLLKGTQVGVNGEISLNEYVAKDGTNKSSIELNVSNVTLLGKKDTTKVAKPDTAGVTDEMLDDLIPF